MNFSEYIIQELNSLKQVNKTEISNSNEVAALIYKFLMSKKFRKYSVTPAYLEHILLAVKNSVQKNEPIKLTLVFGGYKLWRLKESPEVDWAELFSLIYYTKWMKPILEIYQPGVWFDFFSDDVIVNRMNNIQIEDTKAYSSSFKNLLGFVKNYIPENLSFTFNRVGDQYENLAEFNNELDQTTVNIKEEILTVPLTPEQINAIELNVKLQPGQGEDSQWREKVNLMHEAYARSSKRRPYYRTDEKIMVITRPIKDSLAVGTTKRSVVKFWIGAGVVKKEGNDYFEYIHSPKQLDATSYNNEAVNIKGLEVRNFKLIRVIAD